MHKPNLNQLALTCDCSMLWLNLRWLDSTHIAFALQENQEDSQRLNSNQPLRWENVTSTELLAYHRQLFMWRIKIGKNTGQTILSHSNQLYQERMR